MGLYVGAVLVAEQRAQWMPDQSGIRELDGGGVLDGLEELCRDWYKVQDSERHDALTRLVEKPWGRTLAPKGKTQRKPAASAPRPAKRKAPSVVTPPRSLAEARALIDPVLEKSVRPYVRIKPKAQRGLLPLWASKACDGRPYMPIATPWPKVGLERLLPLLQLDFSAVPPLPGFPRSGLLSVFWSEDLSRSKLLYFPEVIRDESKLVSNFGHLELDDALEPYGRPSLLVFEKREGCVTWSDASFDDLLGAKVVGALEDSPAHDAIWNHVWKWSGGGDTHLGGYASPEQEDPRKSRSHRRFATHLLQVENDNLTHNWFIEPEALARADFGGVLYHHACD